MVGSRGHGVDLYLIINEYLAPCLRVYRQFLAVWSRIEP